ncbi:glycosyltransferase [Roseburia sp. OM02-15]|nr:glycosyltransferase [Roseburia sp. OM02-15]
MEIGGAEKALLGLLEAIDKNKFQVELFLLRHTGELLKYIPKNIILLPEKKEYSMLGIPLKETLAQKEYNIFWGRLKGNLKAKKFAHKNHFKDSAAVNDEYSHKCTVDYMPMISDEEYDLVISFLSPHYFVSKKTIAKEKIAWIHTDYETVEIDVSSELRMWSEYDYIASISENVTKSFLKTFPSLQNKIMLFENIMPVKYIRNLADSASIINEIPYDENVVLLSIGRFCTAKNFDNIPDICKKILEAGIKVKWYLVGYGADKELIENKIKELHMEAHVQILGKKVNPYPYIKRCDLYIQPSRYEGKCVSVIEAQMFHKPVIITDYATSKSQLENGVDGVIVPMDNVKCAKGIIEIIRNNEMQKKLIEATQGRDYANIEEINKIYQILDK